MCQWFGSSPTIPASEPYGETEKPRRSPASGLLHQRRPADGSAELSNKAKWAKKLRPETAMLYFRAVARPSERRNLIRSIEVFRLQTSKEQASD